MKKRCWNKSKAKTDHLVLGFDVTKKLPAVVVATSEESKSRQVAALASQIQSQEMLDRILNDCKPELREEVLAELRPHLNFLPYVPEMVDCPKCGFRRGSVIEHGCTGDR